MEKAYLTVGDPGAFGGASRLGKRVGASRKKVEEYLATVDAYTKFKPARKRFERRKTVARHRLEIFQADLADYQRLSRQNNGYRFILVVQDVLSKLLFYVPVKSKKASDMRPAFERIFRVATPKLLHTDRGGEFASKEMQTFFKKHNVKWYFTYSGSKATIAERAIRHLKETLERIFYHTGSYKYIHHLKKLADAYNARPHSRTRIPPNKVTAANEQEIFSRIYETGVVRKPKFRVDDQVRVSIEKGIFAKAYTRSWSDEVFYIKQVLNTNPVTYKLRDLKSEDILGGFYEEELQRVTKDEEAYWDIDKVLRTRKLKNGKTQYYVSFRGYDESHNAWVDSIQKK